MEGRRPFASSHFGLRQANLGESSRLSQGNSEVTEKGDCIWGHLASAHTFKLSGVLLELSVTAHHGYITGFGRAHAHNNYLKFDSQNNL